MDMSFYKRIDYKIFLMKSTDTTSLETTNQNSMKVLKVFEPTNKITWL